MFPAWRLQLREARLAVADGRWDEAAELLVQEPLREFWPAKKLSQELAVRLMERARQRMEHGQSTAGWRDLDRAARLGADEAAIGDFRHLEGHRRLDEALELLGRGESTAAMAALQQMDHRRLGGAERRTWHMIAQYLQSADVYARKGDLPSAIQSVELAQQLMPASPPAAVEGYVARRLVALRTTAEKQQALDARLHAAVAASNWTEVLAVAEALLELAPRHSAARQARQKAWMAVGMEVTLAHYPSPAARARQWKPSRQSPPAARSTSHPQHAKVDTVSERNAGQRIVAWIDEVGGFLICTGDEVVIGQPSGEGGVDVPILGDLSRRHAVIRRDREAYVLTPLHRTSVDGRPITEPTVLRDKSTIRLGDGVELRFRKPHALSSTAVLEIASRHRTDPAVDGIILMSESCILGPQSHSHIRCREWTGDLVLFRRGDHLMCRTQAPLEIDGQTCVGQASVAPNCRIECDEFALSLEEI
ncbi:MAG: FHA domain-containing protein [Pirellulales bacterium]|nr:FHA domain-containing protein [Pirellulales bacterium]